MNQAKTSSIVDHTTEHVQNGQFEMPTWGVITFLIIALFVLKSFIYIKDGNRHGK